MSSELLENIRVKHLPAIGPAGLVLLESLGSVTAAERELGVFGLCIGSTDRTRPTLGLFGGVHACPGPSSSSAGPAWIRPTGRDP